METKPAGCGFPSSANAACLQSSNAEVVCFSAELTRNLDNNGLTYNVKSVIPALTTKKLNSTCATPTMSHIAGKPHEQTNGMHEANDMAVKTGWQEPGVSMSAACVTSVRLPVLRRSKNGLSIRARLACLNSTSFDKTRECSHEHLSSRQGNGEKGEL
jgi:hypothetical protein